MFEWIRRLTANYTQKEYEDWLFGSYLAEIPKGKNVFEVADIGERAHIKDIVCMLSDVAEETGYEPEFLYERFDEITDDYLELGETLGDAHRLAFEETATISYEQDW